MSIRQIRRSMAKAEAAGRGRARPWQSTQPVYTRPDGKRTTRRALEKAWPNGGIDQLIDEGIITVVGPRQLTADEFKAAYQR